MKPNEGTVDRALRVLAGLILLALTFNGTLGAWGWLGIVPVITGAVGYCPLYAVLGIRTCPTKG